MLNFNSLYYFLKKKTQGAGTRWQSSNNILYSLRWGVGFLLPISHYAWATLFFLLLLWFWTVSPTIPAVLEWKSTYLLFLQGIAMSTNFSEFCNHLLARTIGYIQRTQLLGEYLQESSKGCRLDRQIWAFHSYPCQELILLHGTKNATSPFLYFSTRKWVSQYLYLSENYGA